MSSNRTTCRGYFTWWEMCISLFIVQRVSAAKPAGDDGGNGVTLSASPGKLHTFWDGVLGGGDSPATARTAALALAAAPQNAADDLDVQQWIDESFDAAKSAVYKNPPIGAGIGPFTLTQTYKTAARVLAEKRVALGGLGLRRFLTRN